MPSPRGPPGMGRHSRGLVPGAVSRRTPGPFVCRPARGLQPASRGPQPPVAAAGGNSTSGGVTDAPPLAFWRGRWPSVRAGLQWPRRAVQRVFSHGFTRGRRKGQRERRPPSFLGRAGVPATADVQFLCRAGVRTHAPHGLLPGAGVASSTAPALCHFRPAWWTGVRPEPPRRDRLSPPPLFFPVRVATRGRRHEERRPPSFPAGRGHSAPAGLQWRRRADVKPAYAAQPVRADRL
jgi:hypothetical protein